MPEQPVAGDEHGGNSIAEGSGDVIRISGNIVNSTIIVKSVVTDAQAVDLEKLRPEAGALPYQGLQYFTEGDAGRFFGREQLTIRVIGRLARAPFLAVIGASGSGKSSLVRAGVIPALKTGARLGDGSLPPTDSSHWSYRILTPGSHPLEALAAALSAESALPSQIGALRAELAGDPKGMGLAVHSMLAREKRPHLLLVVDQFEEVFTRARSAIERDAFIDALIAASSPDEARPLSVVITLRADFYAQVAQHDALRERISQHQEFIGAMNRAELVDVIVGPLNQNDWKIQEGLVKVILDDVGYEPGALPLLSHALLETWKRRRGRTLTLSGYVESGGVDGAIRETAKSVFEQRLTPEQRPIARMIFLRLAELNEDARDTRRRASFDELLTRSTDEVTIQAVINILADARLVTTSTIEPGDTKVLEVAHESLIHEWPKLQGWLHEDREGLVLHRQLTEAAEDWLTNDRESSLLIRGRRLEQIQAWASRAGSADLLSLHEAEFLEASQANARAEAAREARLARARRTQQVFAAVIASLLVLVGILGYTRLQPPKMSALYNVAVADIRVISSDGQVRASSEVTGAAISQAIAAELPRAFHDDPNIQVWNNRPELRLQRVWIGTVEGDSSEALAQSAADLAERLNADMIIHGTIDERQQPPVLNLEMYLAPYLSDPLDELSGSFELDSPIPIDSDPGSAAVRAEITRQANLLAVLALAQSESRAGRTLEALDGYLQAAALAPESDILQFFIARESLFVIEREAIPEDAKAAFEVQAQTALEQALRLNPQNPRAHVGLGSLNLKRAKRLVEQATDSEFTASGFQQIMQFLDQAEVNYAQVPRLESDPAQYGVPVDAIARLGLGDAQVTRAVALWGYAGSDPGREEFQEAVPILNRAVERLNATLPAFQSPGLERYLARNHQLLGIAYHNAGYLAESSGEDPTAREAYVNAIEQYNACIALGEKMTDLVIRSEIVEANCLPLRQQTEERLQLLDGGS